MPCKIAYYFIKLISFWIGLLLQIVVSDLIIIRKYRPWLIITSQLLTFGKWCRLGELHTLRGHVESVVRLKNLDINVIQAAHTVWNHEVVNAVLHARGCLIGSSHNINLMEYDGNDNGNRSGTCHWKFAWYVVGNPSNDSIWFFQLCMNLFRLEQSISIIRTNSMFSLVDSNFWHRISYLQWALWILFHSYELYERVGWWL